jgi:hypothetical protein
MPLTLQETEVSEVLETVAEKEIVLPRRTVPELGATVTVICGGGGGVEPPPPTLPQADRERARAKRQIARAVWRGTRWLRVEGPWLESRFERVCERGRMEIAIADEGPAKERGGAIRSAVRFANLGIFQTAWNKELGACDSRHAGRKMDVRLCSGKLQNVPN